MTVSPPTAGTPALELDLGSRAGTKTLALNAAYLTMLLL